MQPSSAAPDGERGDGGADDLLRLQAGLAGRRTVPIQLYGQGTFLLGTVEMLRYKTTNGQVLLYYGQQYVRGSDLLSSKFPFVTFLFTNHVSRN